jgi:hypothetical protein
MDEQDNVTLDGSMETVRFLQAKIRELWVERERLEREAAVGRALFEGLEQWEHDTAYGNLRIGQLVDEYKEAVRGD